MMKLLQQNLLCYSNKNSDELSGFVITDATLRRFIDSLDICQSVLAAFFAQLHAGNYRITHPRQMIAFLNLMARHKVIDYGRRHRTVCHGGGILEIAVGNASDVVLYRAPDPGDALANRDLSSSPGMRRMFHASYLPF